MYFSPAPMPPPESDRLLLSFAVALCLHVGLIFVLPHLEKTPSLAPIRIEAQLAGMPEAPSQPPSEAVPPTQSEPPSQPTTPQKTVQKPREITRPVLVAKDESPPPLDDMVVPENPTPSEPAQESASSAPTSENARENMSTAAKSSDSVAEMSSNNPPVSSVHAEEADPAEAWDSYGQMLYNMVSKNKVYPQIAIRRNWQGTAMVRARFSQGRLVELVLLDPTSGHKVLDEAALEMLKKAVSALPVKGALATKSFSVIVPVDFKLEG